MVLMKRIGEIRAFNLAIVIVGLTKCIDRVSLIPHYYQRAGILLIAYLIAVLSYL